MRCANCGNTDSATLWYKDETIYCSKCGQLTTADAKLVVAEEKPTAKGKSDDAGWATVMKMLDATDAKPQEKNKSDDDDMAAIIRMIDKMLED